MIEQSELKNKLAVEELRERGFRWDGSQWISTKSGFFYGRGADVYSCAVSTLESVGFQWSIQDKEWLEPIVLGDDFKYGDANIFFDVFVIFLVIAFFAVIGIFAGNV